MPTLLRQSRYKPMLPFVPPAMLTPGSDDTQSLAVNPRFADALAGVNDTGQDWRGGSPDNTPPVPAVEAKQSSMPPPGVGSTPNQAPRPSGPPGVQQAAAAPQPAPQPVPTPPPTPPPAAETHVQPAGPEDQPFPLPGAAAPEKGEDSDTNTKLKTALKKTQDLSAPTPYTSNWAQRLGMALLASTKLAPAANMIIHPKWSEQERNRQAQLSAAEGQLKDIETAASGSALEAQRTETAERNRLQGLNYTATQAERQRKTEEDERVKNENRTQRAYDELTKGRSVVYRPETEPAPAGWERIPLANPSLEPGMVAYSPSAIATVPKELLEFLPGYQEGQQIDRPTLDKATKAYQDKIAKVAEIQAKPATDKENENQWISDSLSPNPAISNPAKAKLQSLKANRPVPASVQINQAQQAAVTPELVQHFTDLVQKDSKNWQLVQGNKALADAVRTEIGNRGGDVNQMDAQTRDAAKFANTSLGHVAKIGKSIDALEKSQKLGVVSSRWNAFLNGKVGTGDAEFNNLRDNVKLLSSAMARIHGGARGGGSPAMIEYMNKIISAETMDPAILRSSLGVIKDWLQGYAAMGGQGSEEGQAAPKGKAADPLGIR